MRLEQNSKYLGLPTIWGRGKKDALAFLKDRLAARVRGWKGRFLSAAGREILIKAVVSAMPVYVMQIFNIPKSFCKELNVLLNKFWWGGVELREHTLNWMAWDRISVSKDQGGIGFRDFRTFNLALLAKQAWRLLSNPEAKCVKILKAIYFPNTQPLSACKGKKSSWAWKSLFEGLRFLENGLRWNVGNGSDINIWTDKWIPSKPSFRVNTHSYSNMNLMYVSDLLLEDGNRWNTDLIDSTFDEEDAKAIKTIPLCGSENRDTIIWHHASNGIYNVKLGYNRGMESVSTEMKASTSENFKKNGVEWKRIWNLKCLPKIKHFIWKCCHDVAPTNEARARRHYTRIKSCNRCGADEEMIEHAIFFCNHSMAIWRASCFNYTPSLIGFKSFAHWWKAMLEKIDEGDKSFYINLVAATVWGVWKVRNKMVIENIRGDPIKEWNLIENEYRDFVRATESERNTTALSQDNTILIDQNQLWEPPDRGVIKINCDASFIKNSNSAGIVAVARNHKGVVVGGSNEQIVALNAFVAECLAIRLGSKLAEQQRWQYVIIESDCKSAIQMIDGDKEKSWDAGMIIQDIRKKTSNMLMFKANYVSRNKNKLADWLAKATMRGRCNPRV